MDLFGNLFKKKSQQSKKTIVKNHQKLYDILFDWANEHKIDLNNFEKNFHARIVSCYNQNKQEFVTDEKIAGFEIFALISFLIYHSPDKNYILRTLEYITNKQNETYYIQDNFSSYNYHIYDSVADIKSIVTIASCIINFQVAILDTDNKFCSLDSAINMVGKLKYSKNKDFENVLKFIESVNSDKKPYFFMGVYHYSCSYREENEDLAKNQESIKKELIAAIKDYNHNQKHLCKLNFNLYNDFIEEKNKRENSEKWDKTPYNKRRFLKPEDFTETLDFMNKYTGFEKEILFHFFYHFNLTYINESNFYKKIISSIIKKIEFDKEFFQYILSGFNISENEKFFIYEIYTELLKKISSKINYNDEIFTTYEKILFENSRYNDFPKDNAINLLKEICKNSVKEKDLRDFLIQKYTNYFGHMLNPKNPEYFFFIDNKFNSIKKVIADINILTPITLKEVKNNVIDGEYYVQIKVNIDNNDNKITVDDFNKILREKNTNFRFLPIPIQYDKNDSRHEKTIICSFAFLNENQFKYLTKNYLPQNFPEINIYPIYGNITYNEDSKLTFQEIKQEYSSTGDAKDDTFEHNENWDWFKRKYINSLPNKNQWYKIMDIILKVKGSKKPDKSWSKSIKEVIEKHNVDKFFRELNTLLNSSIKENFWFFGENKQFMKAFIWTCQFFPTEESLLILKNIIEKAYTKKPGIGPRSAAIGNIGLNTLAEINTIESFGILQTLRNKTNYQRFIKQIDKSIDLFKEKSPETEEFLADKSIPNLGFKNGIKNIKYPSFEVEYYFKKQTLAKKFILNGKTYSTMPKEIKDNCTSSN
ncbi:hypothetical protein EDL99_06125 [Ornithobacterium rhinotracheale]|uniref:hypothetical protein n=1 Tax=Ornithobacterium rhinotracheale TaxID=28251 RepID=UPI00129C1104|nr:hypothetical protein [Ornithobacterium rhinotracheale]MRJ08448.1 hypothetical protein [Ornithobacterium rhinotracheale]UOH76724.1 hypothetical protein MT996_05705 [Ornithobacterium rhinotracheale]